MQLYFTSQMAHLTSNEQFQSSDYNYTCYLFIQQTSLQYIAVTFMINYALERDEAHQNPRTMNADFNL